ncbi:MAG TPA: o-succinylbenzoate synthase [Gemmatimonadaceae bacterium]|nr:o-succinylbenzoate synthase [Gemmatimonadaceae bacterium]
MKESFRTAQSTTSTRRVILLELTDADGMSAWSECVAESERGYSDETVDSCWTLLPEIARIIVDRQMSSLQIANAILWEEYPENRMSRAPIEMGIWNIAAQRDNKSLAAFVNSGIGEPGGRVPAGIAIGMHDTPDALAARCVDAAAAGYQRIKVKISPGHDVEFVRAARAAVGPEVMLGVDGNRSYRMDRDDDVSALIALDEFDLCMIEQPLSSHDESAALQHRIKTPICLDESISDSNDVRDMIEMDSGRMVNLKPGRVGGFTESIAIHNTCVAKSIPLWCGGMNETGIGRAYNVALASLPGFTLPGDLSPSSRYWQEDIVIPEWTMDSAGFIDVPADKPGLGVEINTALIDRLTTREAKITAT